MYVRAAFKRRLSLSLSLSLSLAASRSLHFLGRWISFLSAAFSSELLKHFRLSTSNSSIKMDSREMKNLEHAHLLWSSLEVSYPGPDNQLERFNHLWRIVDLAVLARLSSDKEPKKIKNPKKCRICSDCISLGVSEDGDEMRGASSKLRTIMRFNQFYKDPKSTPYVEDGEVWAPQGEGAFEGQTPRLKQLIQKEHEAKGLKLQKLEKHEFESCAEEVVYQKLSRVGYKTPKYVYTVQKKTIVGSTQAESDVFKYQVRVVHRCKNCMEANDHLGHVVTDHEALKDLHVPVVTPSVLRFFREVTRSEQVLRNPFKHPMVIVWLHLHRFGSRDEGDSIVLSRSGPSGTEFDEEMATALQTARKKRSAGATV